MQDKILDKKIPLDALAEFALAEAKRCGSTAVELNVTHGQGLEASAHGGAPEKLEHHNDHGFEITVYRGQQKGSASTTRLDRATISKVIQHANDIAQLTAPDEFSGLAPKELMAQKPVSLDDYYPWDISAKEALHLAVRCEQHGLSLSSKVTQSDGVTVSTHTTRSLYANSYGFMGETQSTRHDVTCVLIAEEKGKMERDYYYDHARDAGDMLSVECIAERAAERTVARLNPRRVKTCQVPVLFPAELARGFFRQFISAISGPSLYRGTSFLCDRLGESLFPEFVHIHEKPFLPKAMGSAWFDAEGVACREKGFVQGGVLSSYSLSAYAGRRLGLESTGNAGGVTNLIVESTHDTFSSLLKKMDRGLYVTDILGHGANLVTGDYSVGASGFWVEQGEIQYPVNELTIAANLNDMFKNIVGIGNDVDHRGIVRTGSVLFGSMMVAGE